MERPWWSIFPAPAIQSGLLKSLRPKAAQTFIPLHRKSPYTEEDLNYRNKESRVVKEHDQPDLRPALAGDVPDWDKYETVYIGYPLWWRQAPHVVYSFVESHNFEGKTVIPFCTSTLDPIGTSGENLAKAAGSGNWLEGDRFNERESEKEIRNWVDSLKK